MEINKTIDILNHLINQSPYDDPLSESDYLILRANQLSGSIYPLIKHQKDIYKGFKEDYYRYIQRDEIQIQLIEEIRMIFNQNNIDFVFLKGSFLKTIYPHSFMRPMGDIDILVRPDKMDEVHQVLQASDFENWINSTNHDCFAKNKVNVEIHPKLDSEFSDEYKDLFLYPWQYTELKRGHEYDLLIEYRFFYQLYHMIKHLYHSGVGLRTLIDLQLVLNNTYLKSEAYNDIFHKFPKKDFVIFIHCILNKLMSKNVLFETDECDKINHNIYKQFIEYITLSGTHGIGEDHNLFLGGMASSHKKKEWIVLTKIKFLFSKTFLPYKIMKGSYSYLKKYPILLPLAYIQRIFSLLFKKSSRRKLARMKIDKGEIENVEKLFIDIGIK